MILSIALFHSTHGIKQPIKAIPYALYAIAAQRYTPPARPAARAIPSDRRAEAFAHDIRRVFPAKKQDLEQACELFEKTPGFLKVLRQLSLCRNYPNAKGYWYEIEKAVALHRMHYDSCQQEVIQSFETVIQSPEGNKAREFDIIAQIDGKTIYYECKNMHWTHKRPRLVAQFLDQQQIVTDVMNNRRSLAYIVASKQPIPPRWKRFFAKQSIVTEED
ncbi:MAG TPA: hypothetical protein VI521_02405 [Candidatus Babeliales bacterium]|nr:hypothetical protein [Candidatus Babeliales bacterium]